MECAGVSGVLGPRKFGALPMSNSGWSGIKGCVGLPSQGPLWRSASRRRGSAGKARASDDQDEGGPRKDQGGQKVDWDKAWTKFSSPEKKKSFLNIDMEQYVSRRPEHSNYPLSEEVDPMRKSEKSALGFWTTPQFTYVMAGVIVGLFIYMVIIVGPPPSRH
ncbi:hypothetical protein MPTK1_1g12480 [Marchantia polymorpha subsp. ruderalis]|uniref:Uncharacterized protein n=2 Tax=Marchantia polymorpha TaxID=3197 RepID=A0AAF6APD9_MARPO|nr:hypothetical protein MARPO_0019s0018 [Marchantia polymorpha]BBM98309.1 hypothetical protein Mp_1g12480 [Marchantia polymorpha subsp. ruderalis]|eukprot:PTQ44576.1 hypothetical protein MARPO_0019s0018 [Marchantia polymorpha]